VIPSPSCPSAHELPPDEPPDVSRAALVLRPNWLLFRFFGTAASGVISQRPDADIRMGAHRAAGIGSIHVGKPKAFPTIAGFLNDCSVRLSTNGHVDEQTHSRGGAELPATGSSVEPDVRRTPRADGGERGSTSEWPHCLMGCTNSPKQLP
jgi:hypothetical protein